MNGRSSPPQLDDKDLQDLVKRLSKPTFKYFLKLVEKEVMSGYYKSVPMNWFITIFCTAMANIDGNLIRWLAAFYQDKLGEEAPYEGIAQFFYKTLEEHIETRAGNN
jgi:hypothetical protein